MLAALFLRDVDVELRRGVEQDGCACCYLFGCGNEGYDVLVILCCDNALVWLVTNGTVVELYNLIVFPLDGILSSDLDRVVETVRLAVGSRHLPWQITPLLREINWGSWTGLPIDSVDKSCYPENAETREMLYHRAEQCVDFIRGNYQNTRLLVVAHGLINRSIRAVVCGIPVSELYTVSRMQNGECCRLEL